MEPAVCAQVSPVIEQHFPGRLIGHATRKAPQAEDGFAAVVRGAHNFAEAHLKFSLVREEQGRHANRSLVFQRALNLKPRLRGAICLWE